MGVRRRPTSDTPDYWRGPSKAAPLRCEPAETSPPQHRSHTCPRQGRPRSPRSPRRACSPANTQTSASGPPQGERISVVLMPPPAALGRAAPGHGHPPSLAGLRYPHRYSPGAGGVATWGVLGAPLSPGGAADTQAAGSERLHLPARGNFQCPIPERRPSHWPLVLEARFISRPPSSPALSGPQNQRPEQQEGRAVLREASPMHRWPVRPRLVSHLSTDRAMRATSQPLLSTLCKHGIIPPDPLISLSLVTRTYFGLSLKAKLKTRVKVLLPSLWSDPFPCPGRAAAHGLCA